MRDSELKRHIEQRDQGASYVVKTARRLFYEAKLVGSDGVAGLSSSRYKLSEPLKGFNVVQVNTRGECTNLYGLDDRDREALLDEVSPPILHRDMLKKHGYQVFQKPALKNVYGKRQPPKVAAFLKDLMKVCEAHKMELLHEDSHGAFVVHESDDPADQILGAVFEEDS